MFPKSIKALNKIWNHCGDTCLSFNSHTTGKTVRLKLAEIIYPGICETIERLLSSSMECEKSAQISLRTDFRVVYKDNDFLEDIF